MCLNSGYNNTISSQTIENKRYDQKGKNFNFSNITADYHIWVKCTRCKFE